MMMRPLLVELFTEELPPKALPKLGAAFADGLNAALAQHGLIGADNTVTPFASPRHLAVRLSQVLDIAPDQTFSERLMPVSIGMNAAGAATPALTKKLASKGWEHLDVSLFKRESDGKQEYLVANGTAPGASLLDVLQAAIETTLTSLPIPKVMKYQLADGHTSVKFVRPAHGLVTLFGEEVIAANILGLAAGRVTYGHRFLHPGPLNITHADNYEQQLEQSGHVVVSFEKRRARILALLDVQARQLGMSLGQDTEVTALLDEVTALVEAPAVYVGTFEERFLAVPQECLILTMRLNQKYFPLFDPETGTLTNKFLIVSNMPCTQPATIIQGNERVIRPRLADAEFFFKTDLNQPLASRIEALRAIVYHNKLGTQLERSHRVQKIALWLAQLLGADVEECARAAMLAKADLNTNMVGEFPELQGIMGAYYARSDQEAIGVVDALAAQYRIRLEAPVTHAQLTATVLFMAERAETLVGIWGIGLAPTGERDPYGLRRAALGLISAFEQLTAGAILHIQQPGPLTLHGLIQASANTFSPNVLQADTMTQVETFIIERLRQQLIVQHNRQAVEAVLALSPPLHQIPARVAAVEAFADSPDAASLAAANKRIGNLLKKTEGVLAPVNAELLTEPAEQTLAQCIATIEPVAQRQFDAGDYAAALATLAQTRTAVDTFFNDIMVMAEDPAIRHNRLALLAQLHRLMNQVADISRLAT